jgi:hypothetical protein
LLQPWHGPVTRSSQNGTSRTSHLLTRCCVHYPYHSNSCHRRSMQENSHERWNHASRNNLDIYFHGIASRNVYCYGQSSHLKHLFIGLLQFPSTVQEECAQQSHSSHSRSRKVLEQYLQSRMLTSQSQLLFRPQSLHSFTGVPSKGLKI